MAKPGWERGPQNYNLFSSGVRDRIIKEKYLHSSIANFQNVFVGRNNYEVRKDYLNSRGIYKDIDILIEKARAMEDNFYADFGVTSAGDFSQRYLLLGVNKTNIKTKTIEQKLLYIVSNVDFINALKLEIDKDKVIEHINSKISIQLEKDIFKIVNKAQFIKDIGDYIVKYIKEQMKDGVSKKNVQAELFSKYFMNSASTAPNTITGARNLLKNIVNEAFNVEVLADKVVLMFNQYYFPKSRELEIPEDTAKFFAIKLDNILQQEIIKGVGSQAFFNASAQKGFAGEYAITFANDFSKVIGQKMVNTVVYELNTDSTASKAINKKTGQVITRPEFSPNDMEFIAPKSGRVYYIQAKNSFEDMFVSYTNSTKRYSARFNEQINIKSLMAQMVGNNIITSDTANELMYALMNYEFLSKYNQNSNTVNTITNKDGGINKNQEKIMKAFISQLLANGILYYLGAESLNGIPENFDGNLFVILANTFLVPISYFFEAIKWGLEGYQKEAMAMVARPATTFENKSINSAYAKSLYQDKLDVLPNDNKYIYPNQLLKVGADAGSELLNNTKVSGIYINFNVPAMKQEFIRRAKSI